MFAALGSNVLAVACAGEVLAILVKGDLLRTQRLQPSSSATLAHIQRVSMWECSACGMCEHSQHSLWRVSMPARLNGGRVDSSLGARVRACARVRAYRHDTVCCVEGLFNTITVVDINVHVQDALVHLEQLQDG